MKTLIIILAETRFSDITFDNFIENVVKNDNENDLCVCIAVDNNYDYDDKFYKMAKYKFIINDQYDYGPLFEKAYKEIIEENKDNLEKPYIYWKEFLKLGNNLFGGVISNDESSKNNNGACGILIYFRHFLMKKIIENNLIDLYDRFIITRSDFMYNLPHPKLELLNPEYIWIPDDEHFGGYTDRHVILSKSNIISYLNIFENIVIKSNTYYNKLNIFLKLGNIEELIKFNLIQNNVNHLVKHFPYVMYAIRGIKIDGKRNWWKLGDILQDNYYIKYKTEYLKSIFYKKYYQSRDFKNIDDFYIKYINHYVYNLPLKNTNLINTDYYDNIFLRKQNMSNVKLLFISDIPHIYLNYFSKYFKDVDIYVPKIINNYPYYYDKNKINIYDVDESIPLNKIDIIIINDLYKFDYLFNIINNLISFLADDGIFIIETSAKNINKLKNAFPIKYKNYIKKSETSIIINMNKQEIYPVICSIIKIEHDYIEEFIKYNLALGFKYFYFYDNEDVEGSYNDIFSKYSNYITCFHAPGNNFEVGVQFIGLNHFIKKIIPENPHITHAAHIDIDEFIVLKKHKNISDFIGDYIKNDCSAIGMNWRFFGSSGHTQTSKEPITIRFTKCEEKINEHIKLLFDVKKIIQFGTPHFALFSHGNIKDTNNNLIYNSYNHNRCVDVIQLNHYKSKTLPEYTKLRMNRGRCDLVKIHQITYNDKNIKEEFDLYDKNETEDLNAKIFYMMYSSTL
jgi:hypothetical protein